MFAKHASQLSEILWHGLEQFFSTRLELRTGPIPESFIQRNACRFAAAIHRKSDALDNCIGLIDGTVISIARPGGI